MEAANRGGHDAGTASIGCNIELPHEQVQQIPEPVALIQILLRPKDDVHQVQQRLHYFPGGLEQWTSSLRPDADPDTKDPKLSCRTIRLAILARASLLAHLHNASRQDDRH
jgi:hypothetical protein